jgi:hypothetical protein
MLTSARQLDNPGRHVNFLSGEFPLTLLACQAANEGLARVIIGSTAKLGTGVNVQKRLAALHHLDGPWRPMDVEQRDDDLASDVTEGGETA